MDGTRVRRLKDKARQVWYSTWRTYRFACHMGMRARGQAVPAGLMRAVRVTASGGDRRGDSGLFRWTGPRLAVTVD
jgi:hypothetical protein